MFVTSTTRREKKMHATQCNADILRCSENRKKKRNLI
jgi:hypothetical protein